MPTSPPPAAARPQPQLHGVVIISLPPADDPSKGKTITAFTISDDPEPAQDPDPSLTPPLPPPPPPPAPPVRRPRHLGGGAFSLGQAAVVLFVVAAALVGSYYCVYSDLPIQILRAASGEEERRGDRNETSSFLLPLYPKARGGRVLLEFGDVKLAERRVGDGAEGTGRSKMEVKAAVAEAMNATAVLPIKGNVFPDGQYYTSIFVGNPPRPYFLDVDTGSDLTWIQCDAPCLNCAKGPHPLYKPTKGKIVPPRDSLCQELQGNQNYCDTCKQCDYEIEYADQSSSMGVLARDEMHLITTSGDREKLSFVFGCAYDQQGQLLASPAKTDGILGLSSAAISLPTQLASQGVISNVVGHCITSEPNGGGYMFLGDDYVPRWGMTWVPTRSGPDNLYHTDVQTVNYGDQQLSARGKGGKLIQVIFDSGSSYTFFQNEAYTNLISSFQDAPISLVQDDSDQTLPLCWRLDSPARTVNDVKHYFKPLTLQFGKRWWVMPTTLTIPPEGYLIISDKGNLCLAVLNGMKINHGSTIIIGDVSLRGKLVVYDNEQKQIGWAQSDCKNPQKARGFPFFF